VASLGGPDDRGATRRARAGDPHLTWDDVDFEGDELERAVRLLDRSWIDGPKPSTGPRTVLGQRHLAQAKRLQKFLTQHLARMPRWPMRWTRIMAQGADPRTESRCALTSSSSSAATRALLILCTGISDHRVSAGCAIGNCLRNIPMFDNPPRIEPEDVDDRHARSRRLDDLVHVQDNEVAIGEHPLDLAL
jgi:hypothetical protein